MRPQSPFPRSNLSAVADLVRDRLLADPVLGSAGGVRTWWFNSDGCRRPDVLAESLPALLCTFAIDPESRLDECADVFPLRVRFEMFHPGLDCRDTFDFWAAVVNCLSPPGDNSFLNSLRPLGTFAGVVGGGVPEPFHLDGGAECSYSTGDAVFSIRFEV